MSSYMKHVMVGMCAVVMMTMGLVGCSGGQQSNTTQPTQNDTYTQPTRKSGCGCGR